MAITSTQLATGGFLYTVYTSSGNNAITTMIICNTGAVNLTDETVNACNLTLHLVAASSSATDVNKVISNLNIPAGETVFFSDERIVLGNNDTIQAVADQPSLLSITVSTLPV
jgi:hypothetical protein